MAARTRVIVMNQAPLALTAARVTGVLALALSLQGCALDWQQQVKDGQRQPADASTTPAQRLDGGEVAFEMDAAPATTFDPRISIAHVEDAALGSAPTDASVGPLPAAPLLWFAADLGISTDDGGSVIRWADQSGQGRDGIPGELRPPRLERGRAHLPVLHFDGEGELALPTMSPFGEVSFFAVVETLVEERRCPSILHFTNLVGTTQYDDVEIGRHDRELYYEVTSEFVPMEATDSGTFPASHLTVLGVVHDANRRAVTRVNGRVVHRREHMSLPDRVPRAAGYIGYNHYISKNQPTCDPFFGNIAEIVLFGFALSEEQRSQVERYLSAKWKVDLAAP